MYIPSVEELVDNQSSWRKAAAHNVNSEIREMRRMVPETTPLCPDESDDVIIEEFIPDDSQPMTPRGSLAPLVQDEIQKPPNIGFLATDLTQSDMEIFSLWNGNWPVFASSSIMENRVMNHNSQHLTIFKRSLL